MAFVNEYIPKEDLEKYDFETLKSRPRGGTTPARQWTIDRDADIWLWEFYTESDHTMGQTGFTGKSHWELYWKGTLISLVLETLETRTSGRGTPRTTRKRLLDISLPIELEDKREQIVSDLKAALEAYRDGGVLSSASSYTLIFEV